MGWEADKCHLIAKLMGRCGHNAHLSSLSSEQTCPQTKSFTLVLVEKSRKESFLRWAQVLLTSLSSSPCCFINGLLIHGYQNICNASVCYCKSDKDLGIYGFSAHHSFWRSADVCKRPDHVLPPTVYVQWIAVVRSLISLDCTGAAKLL